MRASYATLVALVCVAGCTEAPEDAEMMVAMTEAGTSADGTEGDGETTQGADDSDDSDDTNGPGTATNPEPSTTGPDPSGDTTTTDAPGGSEETGADASSTGSPVDTGGEMAWHPEFMWLADFMRQKCVACHNMGQNGNLVLPSPQMTNEEVMLAIDGGVATTGRKFIEPFDPPESQAYIMITNEAGEQFDQETIERVADWINLGAPYYDG